jgi:hypothetical protein
MILNSYYKRRELYAARRVGKFRAPERLHFGLLDFNNFIGSNFFSRHITMARSFLSHPFLLSFNMLLHE